ncbi:ferrous iron transport protein A [Arsenicicoccus piscis]|uniref:Ferrous iron transporter FeoA-like domain-containing protein n=1 Tax=Arsenicicoccus piscis TaxID=673954 RepID=A0ABQ6HSM8_9MICO|nr:FeoA domain-containing protein [Arsenicicoccus piscis]MCH8628095.1 ferrous iron transport protein A [Arsenicicoccus piscis]GMA20539.1 hypothetical protein GCM10025862_25600 [Arsenicicoccus piscis]
MPSLEDRVPLGSAPLRAPARVVEVVAAAAPRRRLAELGLRPGAVVQARSRTSGGGRVVAVDGSRIALDRATVSGLIVELADAELADVELTDVEGSAR